MSRPRGYDTATADCQCSICGPVVKGTHIHIFQLVWVSTGELFLQGRHVLTCL